MTAVSTMNRPARLHGEGMVHGIPSATVSEVYGKIAGVLGDERVVLVGGQAVRMHLPGDMVSRDIDVVVRGEVTREELKALEREGVQNTVNDHYNRILYYRAGGQVVHIDPIMIRDDSWPLFASRHPVPAELLFSTTATMDRDGVPIRVVDKGLLVVMKFTAFMERGSVTFNKDLVDVATLLDEHYGSSPQRFMAQEGDKIDAVFRDDSTDFKIAMLATDLPELARA